MVPVEIVLAVIAAFTIWKLVLLWERALTAEEKVVSQAAEIATLTSEKQELAIRLELAVRPATSAPKQ